MLENRIAFFGLIAGSAFVSFSLILTIIECVDFIGYVLGGLLVVLGFVGLSALGFLGYALYLVEVDEFESMTGGQ